MLINPKIGDKVYSGRNKCFENLEIIGINGRKILCKGKEYLFKTQKHEEGYEEFENKEFLDIELFENDIESEENLTKKLKWNKILEISRDVCLDLRYLYEYYIEGELDLEPFYQRDYVWSLEQKLAYIRAVFEKEIETKPTLILNYKYEEKHENLKRYEVLDGKQRLKTLFDLVEDKLILWNGKKFSELSFQDKKHILNHTIRYTQIKKRDLGNLTEVEKVELFLEINELGTKMSEEHIKNIKEKYL